MQRRRSSRRPTLSCAPRNKVVLPWRGAHTAGRCTRTDAPALPPPRDRDSFLCPGPTLRCRAAGSELEGAARGGARGVRRGCEEDQGGLQGRAPQCVLLAPPPPPSPTRFPRTPRHATAREAAHTEHAAHTAWCRCEGARPAHARAWGPAVSLRPLDPDQRQEAQGQRRASGDSRATSSLAPPPPPPPAHPLTHSSPPLPGGRFEQRAARALSLHALALAAPASPRPPPASPPPGSFKTCSFKPFGSQSSPAAEGRATVQRGAASPVSSELSVSISSALSLTVRPAPHPSPTFPVALPSPRPPTRPH